MKRPTILDVGKYAGVSVATVSNVINGTHYVTPELVDRVNDAIAKLGYRPNKLARALTQKDIPLVAIIVPDISNPYWSSLARAVQDISDRNDYSVIVCSSDGQLDREKRFLHSLSGWVSGLIFHPYRITFEELDDIIGTSLPTVVLGEFANSGSMANWDRVFSDNLQSAKKAVSYLADLGHQRIGFIQGSAGTPSSVKRYAGYQEALHQAGLPVENELVVPGEYTQAGGRKAMAALLELRKPPTAVFCANDLSALGALEEARARGLRIPEDLSIVGFDDIEEAALATPALTTVQLPPKKIGIVAAETLFSRLRGRNELTAVEINGTLVIRDSTSQPQADRVSSGDGKNI